jgi:hypothetical protein
MAADHLKDGQHGLYDRISAKAERADPGQPASSRRACDISAGSGAALIFARRLPGNPAARYNARTLKVP